MMPQTAIPNAAMTAIVCSLEVSEKRRIVRRKSACSGSLFVIKYGRLVH
jgi:hypothetical protein